MPEESTTPDVVELTRRYVEAVNRRDSDAFEAFYTRDVVLRGTQIGTFEGAAAARGVLEDIAAPYEEFRSETEEVLDLGYGVGFAVIVARGRVDGGTAEVPFRFAVVTISRDGLIERQTNYTDIDEARAAGERLADERGHAMSRENVEVVKRIYEALNSELVLPPELFAPDCVTGLADVSPEGGVLHGLHASQQALAAYFETFDDFHVTAEVLHADDHRVVTAIRDGGRIKGSSAEIWSHYFHAWTLREGKVVRLSSHTDRGQTLKAVGQAE